MIIRIILVILNLLFLLFTPLKYESLIIIFAFLLLILCKLLINSIIERDYRILPINQ
jgi:hypothetical protein